MKNILYALLTLSLGLVLSGSDCSGTNIDPLPPDGSISRPYIITTAAELDNIRNDLTMHYKLGRNIDLSGYLATGGAGYVKANWGAAGWLPIGTEAARFKGSLDGAGYTITGLWINRTTTDYVGLFGCLDNGATLKNLGVAITSADVKGWNYVGGLVGGSYSGSSITHCYATGPVSGNLSVGGLVGSNAGSITLCYTTGPVNGAEDVGGLVGSNGGSITQCYATGAVSGTTYLGGLVGGSYSGSSITHCYATGAVSGTSSRVGGLVGYINGPISHCYATGAVSGAEDVGGIVGYDNYGTTGNNGISNCVALNPSVRATGSSVGRIVGHKALPYGLANNWANSGMTTGGGIAFPTGVGPLHVNGANVASGTAATQYNNATWWTSISPNGPGWSSTIWTFATGAGQLPKLK